MMRMPIGAPSDAQVVRQSDGLPVAAQQFPGRRAGIGIGKILVAAGGCRAQVGCRLIRESLSLQMLRCGHRAKRSGAGLLHHFCDGARRYVLRGLLLLEACCPYRRIPIMTIGRKRVDAALQILE